MRPIESPRAPTLLWLLLLYVAGCGFGGTGPEETTERITELPRQLSASEREVIRAGNHFGFDLLRQVAEADGTDESLFLSPLSASMALGMTMNGADGETWTQMRGALGFGELPQEEINASYQTLLELLTGLDPTVDVTVGNSLWIRDGFSIETAFRDRVTRFFDARVESLDFSDPAAVEAINAWVRDATNDRIDGIVEPPIDPLTMLFLINAVHFDGSWTHRFEEDETTPAPFRRPDGSTVEVPLMRRTMEVGHGRSEGLVAVDLPYGGEAFSMTVVLPTGDRSLEDLIPEMDAQRWAGLIDGLAPRRVDVALPRFGMEYERTLNDDLKALGMTDVFEVGAADLSRMAENARAMDLHVQNVKQKTFVEVDEEGTEAAGATSVEVGVTSAPPAFRADRPFLFAIRERLSGTILFLGLMTDPGKGR